MNDLRWILIAFGALLLVGIYFWGRRGDKRAASPANPVAPARGRPEPSLEPAPAAPDFSAYSAPDYDEEPDLEPRDFDEVDEPVQVSPRQELPKPPQQFQPATPRVTDSAIRRGRVEPTFSDGDASPVSAVMPEPDEIDPGLTVELPDREPASAPTLGMSSTPQPKRIERRKIIALRLAAPSQRFVGASLRQALEGESLQFGRYDVFHRLHDDGVSIFSVASMMEPGTFDLERMPAQQYSGVTMFAQLPGPVPGVHALQDLVACGKRLQETLGGTLQDERGVPLTVHRIDRLRQEVVDFERAQARDAGQRFSERPSL
ncbi:cell division protein ZipA [Povalibacter uvarum]|uniref:Cell division protein ZipA n=1 Tax=Povalibacter uvarum TaxID=732238 RepID=A0A841HI40_9GAMM|nr:cell division protein ZipA C-terminal FtsZ-binding domain-containing protein [Povalibacter uvarum]MBB6091918.1 cell division protein ZipA [Povalibacter uvarum]